ncbi:MAG: ROK family protein [Candidatus Solibacter usitatus]|nr:ROK family protein [Candidatus Solibacter usitatus]
MYLGIDIGGTRLKAGLVDRTGRIERMAAAAAPKSREALEQALPALARQVLDGAAPAGAGFGCKGIVDTNTAEVRTMPGEWGFLVGVRLRELLQGVVAPDLPVSADNDAKAALAGEVAWGAARGRRDVLMLTLGTGIGGAILADGRILRGASGVAGHMGHVTVEPDGPLCICGNRGCLEAVFSARAIEAEAWTATHQGCVSPMTNVLRTTPAALDCRFIFDQAARGDLIAQGILERRIKVLGAAIAGLLHVLDPEVVILGGSIAEAGAALFEPLQREVDWRVEGLLKRSVSLLPNGVADTSGVVGAAGLAYLAAFERMV